ncbi:MAG: glycoside hydrolase family 55 protein [Gammaproteobacteria bacterium]|nr:glycoside hydrolase family 55 protein [Gammaproteobacteria bacterium]MBT8051041.1 glycoside hydrolase family 55 protein [Gammaproteobacteria bacterium]MBT8056471.1 glycoside hydrolase family 55 protein [Gammaproteobacteria bacterium]NNJ80383.1 hypothetical protein [Xanthomonadales bacterium]
MNPFTRRRVTVAILLAVCSPPAVAQVPNALDDIFIPDYSYAGYGFGEIQPETGDWKRIDVTEHDIRADDGIDDTKALNRLLESLQGDSTPVVLEFPEGRYEITDIIHINRSHTVLRGAGTGEGGSEFYIPRPLLYATRPPELTELSEYLVKLKKIQREKDRNIELPYSPWSWTGGFFWTGVRGQRVKSYLADYDTAGPSPTRLTEGKKGALSFVVDNADGLEAGQVVQINWYNPEGEGGSFLEQLYGDSNVTIGSHHWNFPKLPLSRQQAQIETVSGNTLTIKSPLLHDVDTRWNVDLTAWQHLEEVGFEHFRITFPPQPQVAHHVEPGFNAIYLTGLFNGWVRDIVIENADSAILTEGISNVTIERVTTQGSSLAHYSVQLGGVHNVLVKDLVVENRVRHPLSFNTFANKSVYLNAFVRQNPVLDQHAGANHHNLFDHTRVQVKLDPSVEESGYALFEGGGAGYWKPSHGINTTFWNTQVVFTNGALFEKPILLNGMEDGPGARVIGVSANLPIGVKYGPNAYIEGVGTYYSEIPSLYLNQLNRRLAK